VVAVCTRIMDRTGRLVETVKWGPSRIGFIGPLVFFQKNSMCQIISNKFQKITKVIKKYSKNLKYITINIGE
jgi:hypothetical protein